MFRVTVNESQQVVLEHDVANLGQAEYLAGAIIQSYGHERRSAIRGDNCGARHSAEYLEGWEVVVTIEPA